LAILFATTATAQNPGFDLFSGRCFNGHQPLYPDGGNLDRLLKSDIAKEYPGIKFARSLLISDCGASSAWCDDPAFSFQAIFPRAARIANAPSDAWLKQWYASEADPKAGDPSLSFQRDLGKWHGNSLKDAPFQTLAIVNRMDLAEWKQGNWTGAEVRFAYGLLPSEGQPDPPPQFTLILEFVLPPFDWTGFQDLAREWKSLSSTPDSQLVSRLQSVLAKSRFEQSTSARLRVNYLQAEKWRVAQWDVSPKPSFATTGTGLPHAPLTDEISSTYLKAKPARSSTRTI